MRPIDDPDDDGDGNGGPPAGPPAPPAGPPQGPDAVAAASEPHASKQVQANALAYFMGEEPAPNAQRVIERDVDFGELGAPNLQPCEFRVLDLEELDKADEEAKKATNGGLGELGGAFVRWSYVFAYACRSPDLSQALIARRELERAKAEAGDTEAAALAKRLVDPSALVREVFRKSSGVLQVVAREIEKEARLFGSPDQIAIREVEAGKI